MTTTPGIPSAQRIQEHAEKWPVGDGSALWLLTGDNRIPTIVEASVMDGNRYIYMDSAWLLVDLQPSLKRRVWTPVQPTGSPLPQPTPSRAAVAREFMEAVIVFRDSVNYPTGCTYAMHHILKQWEAHDEH